MVSSNYEILPPTPADYETSDIHEANVRIWKLRKELAVMQRRHDEVSIMLHRIHKAHREERLKWEKSQAIG